MGIREEIFRQFNQGNGEWKQFIKSIRISNIHGWQGQEIRFDYPVVAIVGENGIGKSTILKSAVCAYRNKRNKDFYPSKMFVKTRWDEDALRGASIEYRVRQGNEERILKWKKTKDWGFTPKSKKPERNVFFLDISRTLPKDAAAGYAKIAMTATSELGEGTNLNETAIKDLSYVLGYEYSNARFVGTNVNTNREIGLLTRDCGEISQFHQGAGEDSMLDMFKLLQEIPSYSLLVIDEVENSLHPQAQRRFINLLLKMSKDKKLQIILSTHSPFVLEELPEKARIMLLRLSGPKEIVYEVSSRYALSTIDENPHPELYVFVEDEEATALFWEIMKRYSEKYTEYAQRLLVKAVGSYSVVKTLDDLAKNGRLPYPAVGIIDGDQKDVCPNCLSLPGNLAPEIMVFRGLKSLNWNRLDERFGIGAGNLFSILDNTVLLPDHHEWTSFLGDKTKKSKDIVWSIMVEEWCEQCLSEEDAHCFIESVEDGFARLLG